MTLDVATRRAIVEAVNEAIAQRMEEEQEVWLTAKQLHEHFAPLTANWLTRFGHCLPRSYVKGTRGTEVRHGHWLYPKHKISRMLANGELSR